MKIAPNGVLKTDATIPNTYALVAAVYRQAIRDAGRGDRTVTCPDWQELANKYKGIKQRERNNSACRSG